MAISFSRPDPSSPAAVADANFPTSRRGFDQHEVREFLRMVAAELARSQERERYLEQELRARRQQPVAPTLPAELDDETIARLLGEETTRIVQAARESASAIRSKAEESSERLLRDAREESQRLREDAELEATRRRKDAEADAEAELEMAKQQGREMVDEARAYRERALGELARRRDLARQQIDQLVHGRDRLVQAFERARLAAADVVAELVPLGELDEYVNLSPTTGPVPVMLPASKLADRSAISDDALALHVPPEDLADPPLAADPTAAVDGDVNVADHHDHAGTDDRSAAADADADAVGPAESVAPTDDASADEAPTDGIDVEPDVEVEPAPDPVVEPQPVGRDATVLQFPVPARPPEDDDTLEIGVDDAADDDPTADLDTVVPGDDPTAGLDTVNQGEDEIDDDDVTASDVDDLFARLRAQRVGDPSDEIAVTAAPPPPGAAFEHRDEVLTPLIVAAARKLKRVLADEQNDALDTLRRKEPVTALAQLVPTLDQHSARYADAISGEVVAAAQAGADTVRELGHPSRPITGADVAVVDAAVRDHLIVPLRDRLADRIRVGEADNEVVTKSARAVYREWKTKHIDDHLDDLLRLAFNRGVLAALPAGTSCRWTVDPAVGACADCDDNTLQGPVPAGQDFPTGHVTGPAHPGCRCLLAPEPPR